MTIDLIDSQEQPLQQPYQAWLWVRDGEEQALFYATCHYAGKIQFGTQVYDAVAFEQFQHDGLYRESGLWLDLNRNQKLDDSTEHFSDKATLRVGNLTYRLELRYP